MIALIWTLHLQRKAIIIQAEAVKIEEERERRNLLPIFTITMNSTINLNNIKQASFTLNLERGDAFNVGIGPNSNEILDFERFNFINHWRAGDEHNFIFQWVKKGGLSNDSRIGPSTAQVGKMYFYDEGRRAYSQIFHTNGHNIHLSLAKQIDENEMTSVIYNFQDFK
jgi:hypothetical protein